MNAVRDVLALYAGKDALFQKFFLAQLADAEAELGSREVAGLLWREAAADEPAIRRQARVALGSFLPGHVAHGFGLDAAAPGRHAAAPTPEILSNALRTVLRATEGEGHVLAGVLSGLVRTPWNIEALRARVELPTVDLEAGLALAEVGGGAARETLHRALRTHGPGRPDVFLCARPFTDQATLELLDALEPGASGHAGLNIALALALHEPSARRGLLGRLIDRRQGWITAAAMLALQRAADPGDFELVQRAYEPEALEFVRYQVVRAAANVDDPRTVAFCMDRLTEPPSLVQAAALEALARLAPAAVPAGLLERHLASPFLRCRVNATLVLGRQDPARGVSIARTLMVSGETVERLEGTYLCGELRLPGGAALLAELAATDAAGPVRASAVTSLARYAATESAPALARLVERADLASARLALRALAHLDGLGADVTTAAQTAVEARAAPERAALLPDLCGLAARSGLPVPRAALAALTSNDAPLVIGALEGLKRSGDAIPHDAVAQLAGHPDPRCRIRGASCRLLAGDAFGADAIAELASSDSAAERAEAASALVELVVLSRALAAAPGFRAFGRLVSGDTRLDAGPASRPATATTRRPKSPRSASPVRPASPLPTPPPAPTFTSARIERPAPSKPALRSGTIPAPGALEEPSGWSDRSSAGIRALSMIEGGAAPSRRRVVVAAMGLALAIGGALLAGRSAPPGETPTAGRSGWMRAWALTGRVEVRPAPRAGSVLRAGDRVASGSTVSTDAGGSLELRDAAGNTIRLGAASSITLGIGPPGAPRYQLRSPSGTLRLDLSAEPVAAISLPSGELELARGVAEIAPTATGLRASITAGSASITRPGKPRSRLSAGAEVD